MEKVLPLNFDCLLAIVPHTWRKQLFVLDLSQVSLDSPPPAPLRLADLPAGASYIEQMQWRPAPVS
jgi:hypothetical protein